MASDAFEKLKALDAKKRDDYLDALAGRKVHLWLEVEFRDATTPSIRVGVEVGPNV
jgi:hypothetical protein